jgi:hypothetical protein
VTERQELPDLKAHYSMESGLSQRVSKSYGLALVLVISEFSRNNAVALEALRSWAHENFQHNPAFLHAVPPPATARPHNSLLDAFCYSLLTPPQLMLEDQAMRFLQSRIAAFHNSKAYQSFRVDYFDSFGLDHESARLLALYQSERARQAVGVLLSALFWCAAILVGTVLYISSTERARSSRWQRALAFFWFSVSLFYIIVSWVQNDVSILVSSIICALAGLYIRRPIAVSFGEDKGLTFRLLVPQAPVLTFITWISVSLVSVQLLAWMSTGNLTNSDPVMLFISALQGDFVHDHGNAKKHIARALGLVWLLTCGWALWNAFQARSTENVERGLKPLKDTLQ